MSAPSANYSAGTVHGNTSNNVHLFSAPTNDPRIYPVVRSQEQPVLISHMKKIMAKKNRFVSAIVGTP
jgi:hypothetical protein